jgi:hypothetical protein
MQADPQQLGRPLQKNKKAYQQKISAATPMREEVSKAFK